MENFPAPVDSVQSARTVREDTAELASYFLSVKKDGESTPFLSRPRSLSAQTRPSQDRLNQNPESETLDGSTPKAPEPIEEISESPSPEVLDIGESSEGPSMLAAMLRRSPPDEGRLLSMKHDQVHEENFIESDESDGEYDGENNGHTFRSRPALAHHEQSDIPSEVAPLIPVVSRESLGYGTNGNGHTGMPWDGDLESQKSPNTTPWKARVVEAVQRKRRQVGKAFRAVRDPKLWNRHALWENLVVAPVVCMPAVIVGLLLNILDALSYGL